jgi:hypothetical protein
MFTTDDEAESSRSSRISYVLRMASQHRPLPRYPSRSGRSFGGGKVYEGTAEKDAISLAEKDAVWPRRMFSMKRMLVD